MKRRRRLRLVEVEVLLDFLPVGGLRQGELQEAAGLLRIQFAGGDPVLGLVVRFSVLRGGARRNSGGANNDGTVLRGLFKNRPDGLVDVAVADAGVHDALVAGLDERFSLEAFHAGVVVDNADLREFLQTRDVERRGGRVSTNRKRGVRHLVVEDRANLAEVGGLERFGLNRVGLDDFTGADDDVVHGDHDALLGGFRRGGGQNGVVEVARAVSTEARGRQHGADHGDGLVSVYNSVEANDDIVEGKTLKKGDEIGVVSTNNRQEYKDGAHLHFEVYESDKRVSPLKYLEGVEK